MSIRTVCQDLFKYPGIELYCHQVNAQGKMGKGIAKTIKNKFPKTYESYMNAYNDNKLELGRTIITHEQNKFIANICAQENYGNRSDIVYTDYEALQNGFLYIKQFCLNNGIKYIGIPCYIGCGCGNGDWNTVVDIIYSIFNNCSIDVIVCVKPNYYEKISLNWININCQDMDWSTMEKYRFKLSERIIEFVSLQGKIPKIILNDNNVVLT